MAQNYGDCEIVFLEGVGMGGWPGGKFFEPVAVRSCKLSKAWKTAESLGIAAFPAGAFDLSRTG